ncbi:major facilitator superfamily transporter [Dinoroseobacter shibae DFL 12 = DSM 16493]|jgi:DHA1 family bicyclomycin/chloramphenicol resistance-like MFS transporter|uniref:Major facilitator superfamily transporter n=2 Tax=Pseudomonadota TaxID=1224 RepID=A8LKT7_DINSH|nr:MULTISPECIES: multidrug effflux MFS transporter [Dinoroseobacter]ABV93301.1 major facilitator superfamily transporter [Dinoroseobacter shibae DFL 12 = DSM 16493]MDD9715608.1 multidrug effflux MFS transporter [Dinoroseobacter sp. PD6]URF48221.1 multidrug effflux MFS transporter [Dinoroseobacter shibae]URF52531.1 multidrug effflux MFS transporter [Dinoroseobacter shibae]
MPPARLSQAEFIALMAMLFATIAFSIDAMLPALPEIAAELTPGDVNRAQLIVTSFVFGMGLGTLVAGPLSDAFGRKPVIVAGAVLYCAAAGLAWAAQSLELALAARVLQGFGAAAPRVVAIAMVRDLYVGRHMARIMSLVFLIFALIPAIAPSLGAVIIHFAGWRAIFASFILFAMLSVGWMMLRQAETLAPEARRPLSVRGVADNVVEVLRDRVVRLSILAQTMAYATLFATLSSTQPVFDVTFGKAETFHLWFAVIALLASSASYINSRLVVRLGMRRMVRGVLTGQIAVSGVFLSVSVVGWPEALHFWAYFVWVTGVFFMAGMTLGNLNAIAMEPMGHIAGTAASVVGALSTMGSVLLAIPIGLLFDGTPVPGVAGVLVLCLGALAVMKVLGARGEAPA